MLARLIHLWTRLPLLVRAPIIAFLVLNIGTTATLIPLVGNLKLLPSIPWAFPATIVIVWLFWRYFTGSGWPRETREIREHVTRRKSSPLPMWRAAALPIIFSVFAVISLRLVLPRLLPVEPARLPIDPNAYPVATVIGLALALAFSAGVVEEVAFRGYLQKPLEEKYGIAPALIVTGIAFWFAHVPKVTLSHLPFHLLASILLGLIAYRTDSLFPAMLGHALGDALLLPTYIFHRPAFAWSALSARPLWAAPAVHSSETLAFASCMCIFLVSTALAIVSLRRLGARMPGVPS
jgi:membrane protease YdiL (CAAX protease family)